MSRSKRNAAAEEYFKRAPNYSAEAIESLSVRAAIHAERGNVRASAIYEQVSGDLLTAHKFALPQDGYLFDKTTVSMSDSFRLPFDRCALEFKVTETAHSVDTITGRTSISGDRAIVLAVKDGPEITMYPLVRTNDGWALQIWFPVWTEQTHGVDARHVDMTTVRQCSSIKTADGSTAIPSGRGGLVLYGMRFDGLGEIADNLIAKYSLTAENVHDRASYQSGTFIQVVLQLCAALACTNVTTDVIRPNREARAARPASTLFDYHVLMIRAGAEHATSEDHGGTHASPRTHLRRGHIRRLAWGPRVWVNSCVVNPSAIGTVNKDYRVIV